MTTLVELPEVRRVDNAGGSRIEPSARSVGPGTPELAWHIAVAALDMHPLALRLFAQAEVRQYSETMFNVEVYDTRDGHTLSVVGPLTWEGAQLIATGISIGCRASRQVIR